VTFDLEEYVLSRKIKDWLEQTKRDVKLFHYTETAGYKEITPKKVQVVLESSNYINTITLSKLIEELGWAVGGFSGFDANNVVGYTAVKCNYFQDAQLIVEWLEKHGYEAKITNQ
jgi:hypothetical protein